MSDIINWHDTGCPKCGSKNYFGVEYSYDDPKHYDGVSEWQCGPCNFRQGRFSGKELTGTDQELPPDYHSKK